MGRPAARIVTVGGSAGALAPLLRLVEGLRTGVDAALVVCLHRPESGANVLASLLSRRSAVPATEPKSGDPVHAGYVFVAPAAHHLEIADGRFALSRGPRVNGQRPSIDLLFRSAARAYDSRAVGVLLSGTLDDGASGLHAIEHAGGTAIVQDPDDADFPDLPRAGILRGDAPVIAPADGLLAAVRTALGLSGSASSVVGPEGGQMKHPQAEASELGAGDETGHVIGVTCPECGGSLWLTGDEKDPVISCRVGHAMGPESLHALHSERVDRALWASLRMLEETVAVSAFMRQMAERRGEAAESARHAAKEREAKEQAAVLRELLVRPD